VPGSPRAIGMARLARLEVGALGGTRTPNLLIRRGINVWSLCPITSQGIAKLLLSSHISARVLVDVTRRETG
jgi:hypothetical protein